MNSWITNFKKIKIKIKQTAEQILKRKERIDPSESLWLNCPSCGELNLKDSLRQIDWSCKKCLYNFDKPPGEIIAKTLHEKGFKNLYLCTGYRKSDLPEIPWIKDVLPKNVDFINLI